MRQLVLWARFAKYLPRLVKHAYFTDFQRRLSRTPIWLQTARAHTDTRVCILRSLIWAPDGKCSGHGGNIPEHQREFVKLFIPCDRRRSLLVKSTRKSTNKNPRTFDTNAS